MVGHSGNLGSVLCSLIPVLGMKVKHGESVPFFFGGGENDKPLFDFTKKMV